MNQSQSQLNYISHFQDTFGKNPIAAVNILTPTVKSVLNVIAGSESKHGYCWLSQSTIAEYVGCTTRHVSRCINYLCSIGLLTKIWQPWTTCNYTVAECLKRNGVIVLLESIIPRLSGFYKKIVFHISQLGSKKVSISKCPTTDCIDRLDLSKSCLVNSSKQDAQRGGARGAGNRPDVTDKRDRNPENWTESNKRLLQSVTKRHELNRTVTKAAEISRSEFVERLENEIALKKAESKMSGEDCYYFNKQKLTLRGRIDLSPFRDDIVREAFETLNTRYKPSAVKSPLALLFGMCKKRSDELGIDLDYGARNRLYSALGDDKDIQPLWERATPQEIAAHSGQTRQADSFKKQDNKSNTGENLKRESWQSHSRPEDIPVTIYLTPAEVLKNVETLESAPMHKGINFREVFAKELVEGETIVTKEREIREKKKALEKLGLPLDGSLVYRKQQPESNTINEKGLGNVNGRQEEEKFTGVDRGHESGGVQRSSGVGFQSMGHVMGGILRRGAAAKSGPPRTATEDELRNIKSFRAFETCNTDWEFAGENLRFAKSSSKSLSNCEECFPSNSEGKAECPNHDGKLGTYYEDNGQLHGDIQTDFF